MRVRSRRFGTGISGIWLLACGAACQGDVQSGLAASGIADGGAAQASAGMQPAPNGGAGAAELDAGKSSSLPVSPDAGPKDGGAAAADASTAAAVDATADATAAADAASVDAQMPDEEEPVIVAVGYLGLRVMSRDLGHTWEHKQNLSDPSDDLDNPALLRAVAYGHDLFVAAGHRIFTSPDAITWTERANPQEQWIGGVQWGNDRFVAAGGYGESWYSTDGTTWLAGGRRDNNSHVRSLAFGNGEFRAANDDGEWWRSENGETWELVGGGHSPQIGFCDGMFRELSACGPAFGHGVYIEGGDWDENVIRYSTDRMDWHDVTVTYMGDIRGIAFGFAH